MKKIDPVVLHETIYIGVWVIVLSALMQAVFLVSSWWNMTVMWGNLLGGGAALLNFFLMALTVQKALEKDEKEAKNTMKLSQSLRMLFLFGIVAVGAAIPSVFNIFATVIPLLFPRFAIMFRGFFDKKQAEDK